MKSCILHGDNAVASRQKLLQLLRDAKKKGLEVTRLDGKTANESELRNAAQRRALFTEEQLIVVEQFISGNRTAAKVILSLPTHSTFVFWENKSLTPTILKKLASKFEILEFKIPPAVFKFLESLTPGSAKKSLKLAQQAVNQDSAEFLLYMLARQVRLLLWAKADPKSLKIAPWQKDRLLKQAAGWARADLLQLHSKLLEIDRMQKKSQLPEDLSASLDLLLASL